MKIAWQSSHVCAEQAENRAEILANLSGAGFAAFAAHLYYKPFHACHHGYLLCASIICFVRLKNNIFISMQRKAACEEQRDVYWNYDTCACEKRGVVARGAGEEPRTNSNCGEYARWASGAHRVAR